MGTGFSVVCSSKRSVIISNSIQAVRKDPDVEADDTPVRIPSKLHACESRDSGIVENEIPHYLSFSRPDVNIEDEIFEDDVQNDSDNSDDTVYRLEQLENKPSRPHSCRLGNRGNTAKNRKNKDSLVQEEKLVRILRQSKSSNQDRLTDDEQDDLDREDSFYQGFRVESARRGNKRKSAKSYKSDGKRSSRTITDLNSSSDNDDVSDSEVWTIPDETDTLSPGSKGQGNRKGWVMEEGATTRESSGSTTPTSTRSGQTIDYYKIVSESYERYDANLAKKASERSISSILLMPVDGFHTPTNSVELLDTSFNSFPLPYHLQRRMDDLVTAFLDALQERHSQGRLTQNEYQNVMRNLRYQLVEFVFTCITSDVTPRLEVTADPNSEAEAEWSVQIQLRPSDEHILQTSEKQLARKLAEKGDRITREDIIYLLGDHLRTIEQLQHVRDNERCLTNKTEEKGKVRNRNMSAPVVRKEATVNSKRKKTPASDFGRPQKPDAVSTARRTTPGTISKPVNGKPPKSPHKENQADSDSDATIGNQSDTDLNSPVTTPVMRKSLSLDERKLKKTINPSLNSADNRTSLASDLSGQIWRERARLSADDILKLLNNARDRMCRHGNEEEILRLDREFIKEIRQLIQRNAITRKELETQILTHMKKTGNIRVKAISVGPAPLKHTRSLNDAVGDTRAESSAHSNSSRRSEPDMRKWRADLDENSRQNGVMNQRVMTGKRRAGAPQMTGLAPMEPLSEGAEENHMLTRVEEIEGKSSVKSRPDSGIAVSMSSGSYSSYSSSEATKEPETDDIDEACLTETPEMIDRVEKVKAESHNDVKSLVAAITKGLMTQQLKAHALYCWLTSLDLSRPPKGKHKSTAPATKVKALIDKKLTYAQFYQELCRAAGIKCEKVEGFVKSQDYLPGNTVQSPKFQHTWCAVQLDGHYRLVDPLYGAKRDKDNTHERFYMDHYFMTSPDNFLLSHYPKEKRWLLMNQTYSIEGFEEMVKTWPAMFHFNIRPLSMKSVIRTYDGKLSITVLLRNVAVNPSLEYSGPGPELDAYSLKENIIEEIRDVENAETFHITLPQEGNYYFTLDAHVLEDEIDVPVFQCRIEYVDELL
uniref:Kyphoscoliosis peptidase n=1 Tax=Magallana gigas TaxID=29159 RepID=K1QI36_MAGGI